MSKWLILLASAWYTINDILHTFFVILGHKGSYDKNYIRLLMDGHILIFTGVIVFISWLMAYNKIPYAGILGITAGLFMLIYCGLIFSLLPSYGTIAVSIMLIIVSFLIMNGDGTETSKIFDQIK